MPEGEQGLNIARVVGLLGGLPVTTSGMTINRFCSAASRPSRSPPSAWLRQRRRHRRGRRRVDEHGADDRQQDLVSAEVMDRFPTAYTPMGITAENVATRFEISREDAGRLRRESHRKAAAAQAAGRFDDEIVPVKAVRLRRAACATT
jgi:acetyl-CoA acyltransferase